MQLTLPAKEGKKRIGPLFLGIMALLLAGAGLVYWYVSGRLNFDGELQNALSSLGPEQDGAIAGVDVRDGERVRKGQILIRLDDSASRQRLRAEQEKLAQLEMSLPPAYVKVPKPDSASGTTPGTTDETLMERLDRHFAEEREAQKRLMDASDVEAEASIMYSRVSSLVSQGKMGHQDRKAAEETLRAAQYTKAEASKSFEVISLRRASTERDIRRLRDAQAASGAAGVPEDKRLHAYEEQKKRVAEAAAETQNAHITAPADGYVVSVLAKSGSKVAAMQPCLYFYAEDQPPGVVALVSEKTGLSLKPGQQCRIRLADENASELKGYIAQVGQGQLLTGRLPAREGNHQDKTAVWVAFQPDVSEPEKNPERLRILALQGITKASVTVYLRQALYTKPADENSEKKAEEIQSGQTTQNNQSATPAKQHSIGLESEGGSGGQQPGYGSPPVVRAGTPEARGLQPVQSSSTPVQPPLLPPMQAPKTPGTAEIVPQNNPSLATPEVLRRADDPTWQ